MSKKIESLESFLASRKVGWSVVMAIFATAAWAVFHIPADIAFGCWAIATVVLIVRGLRQPRSLSMIAQPRGSFWDRLIPKVMGILTTIVLLLMFSPLPIVVQTGNKLVMILPDNPTKIIAVAVIIAAIIAGIVVNGLCKKIIGEE